jgi:hypothetical protein
MIAYDRTVTPAVAEAAGQLLFVGTLQPRKNAIFDCAYGRLEKTDRHPTLLSLRVIATPQQPRSTR